MALLTADEVAYAGGFWNIANSTFYLKTGQIVWTLSPSYFDDNTPAAGVFSIRNSVFVDDWVTGSWGLRPSISLVRNTAFKSGDGTSNSPYIVE